jgi:Bacterial membrane protein YfhO
MTRRYFPLLILAGALLVAFYRLLLGEVFFWGLPSLQFYPWREYAFDVLRHGQLPLWNPYNGAGAPLLANYQSALLYPPNWLGLILPLAWSMSMTAVVHLFIGGWGMWAFTGRLGLPHLGRGVSALAFGMTSYLVARLGTYPMIAAAVWIPWVLWAVHGLLTQFRRRDAAWLALFAALQLLAGHAQITWYSMLLAGAFAAWWSITHRPIQWQRLGIAVLALVLGAGITAVQLVPTGELLLESQRSGGVDYDFAMNYSYAPARILNLLSPNFFGNPGDGTYATKGAFFEDAVYVGLIPLISALAALFAWGWGKLRRKERPDYFATVPFWLLVVLLAYIFALGKNTPVFPFLYRNIPTFSLFQGPERWHIWTVFGLSVLAGIGMGMWGRGHWLLFSTRLATAACIGAALLALAAPNFLPADTVNQQGVQVLIHAVITTGVLGALAGAMTLTQPELPDSRWRPLWMTAVLVIVAGDLIYASLGLNPTVSASFYGSTTSTSSSERAYWSRFMEDNNEVEPYLKYLKFGDYRTVYDNLDAYRSSHLADLNLLDRVPLLNNFDPLLVANFAQYIDLIEANPAQRDKLLQAAGVSSVFKADGQLQPLDQPTARAWFVKAVCAGLILPGNGILTPDWQPADQVYVFPVETDSGCSDVTDNPGEVLDLQDNGDSVVINVQTDSDGVLVLADTYYPGWTASIDGQPAEIHRANVAFRAVNVPAGAKVVRFDYQPGWLLPSILVSFVSLLVMLVLFRSKNPERA